MLDFVKVPTRVADVDYPKNLADTREEWSDREGCL